MSYLSTCDSQKAEQSNSNNDRSHYHLLQGVPLCEENNLERNNLSESSGLGSDHIR
jgi:hypothetical protein